METPKIFHDLSAKSPLNDPPNIPHNDINLAVTRLYKKYSEYDLEAKDTLRVFKECTSILGGYFSIPATSLHGHELWFFRVRLRSSFDDESKIFDSSQHTYTPVNICLKTGRCHVKGHPVFYGSGSVHCAVQEMDTPDESRYILSIWKLPPQEKLNSLSFFQGTNLQSEKFRSYKDKTLATGYKQFDVNDFESKAIFRKYAEAWSNIFTSKSHPLSASMAHQLLYVDPEGNKNMIMYPSVKSGVDVNYALHPYIADKLVLYKLIDLYRNPETGSHSWVGACDGDKLGAWRAVKKIDYPNHDPLMPHSKA